MISSGRADQRPRRGDALLLADAQVRLPTACDAGGFEAEPCEQPRGLGVGPAFGASPARGAGEKLSGSRTLSSTRVGQQVEHLEDDAEVRRPEAGRARPR